MRHYCIICEEKLTPHDILESTLEEVCLLCCVAFDDNVDNYYRGDINEHKSDPKA